MFWSRAQLILFALDKPRPVVSIERRTGIARATIYKLLKTLEERGLVTVEKEGKFTFVSPTALGKEVRKRLLMIYERIEPDASQHLRKKS